VIKSAKFACKDNLTEEYPTCGWQYSDDTRISNSQGFCCECSLFNFSSEDTRGSSCSTINLGTGSGSAHCLRFSDPNQNFMAFSVGPPNLSYHMTVNVALPKSDGTFDI